MNTWSAAGAWWVNKKLIYFYLYTFKIIGQKFIHYYTLYGMHVGKEGGSLDANIFIDPPGPGGWSGVHYFHT